MNKKIVYLSLLLNACIKKEREINRLKNQKYNINKVESYKF